MGAESAAPNGEAEVGRWGGKLKVSESILLTSLLEHS